MLSNTMALTCHACNINHLDIFCVPFYALPIITCHMRKSIDNEKFDTRWCGRLLIVGKNVMLMVSLDKN